MNSVFEVTDNSDEETYFQIGMFPTLKEAIAAIESNKEPWELCENAMYGSDFAKIGIYEREFGIRLRERGKLVWKRSWSNIFDGEESKWVKQ